MTQGSEVPTTFLEVLDLWPLAAEAANDITKHAAKLKVTGDANVTVTKVRDWRRRHGTGRIPPKFFHAVASAATAAGWTQVTYALLTSIHKSQPPEAQED